MLFQFLCRYIFFLYVVAVLLICVFYVTQSPSLTQHQATPCTFYCEDYGCTHGLRLARFYPLVQRQVAVLYSLPGAYKQANLVVYLMLLPLLIVGCLSSLLGGSSPHRPVRWWHWAALLISALALAVCATPGSQHRLFYGAIGTSLWLARQLKLSLYDTYIVVFALAGPALLTLLLVAATGRLLWLQLQKSGGRI